MLARLAGRNGVLAVGLLVVVSAGAAAGQMISLTAVTFNVGTSPNLAHDLDPNDGYTSTEAQISDEYYGNGLAWIPAIDAAEIYFAALDAEIIAFQEVFDAATCPTIPPAVWPGFVCETWSPGDPSVMEMVLGPDYQIACQLGRPDKCLAVRTDFGSFAGCTGSLCLDGLDGAVLFGCGSGSRVGRGRIQMTAGGEIVVAHIHGTSGLSNDDQECREWQIEQLFQNLDGSPAADGLLNIVLGDFNTDPVRLLLFDSSARRLTDFVGASEPFDYLSPSGPLDPPSYQSSVTLDHVISDSIPGSCEVPGLTPGVPEVFDTIYFDHKPVVCVPEPALGGALGIGVLSLAALGPRARRGAPVYAHRRESARNGAREASG